MFNLSNPVVLLSIVLLVVTIVMIGVIVAIPYLVKKGVNVEKYVKTADDVLDKADTVIKVADDILPNNPVLNVLKAIEKYAHIGVNEAEQLYLTSQLGKDDRNSKAKEDVYAVLKLLGVTITPNLDTIINGAIETEVLALGHNSQEKTQAAPDNIAAEKPLEPKETAPTTDTSNIDAVTADKVPETNKQETPADTSKADEIIPEANQSGESTNTTANSDNPTVISTQPAETASTADADNSTATTPTEASATEAEPTASETSTETVQSAADTQAIPADTNVQSSTSSTPEAQVISQIHEILKNYQQNSVQ